MTPEAQRIAIAEACGWKNLEVGEGITGYHDTVVATNMFGQQVPLRYYIPDYLNDLNAMHEAEKILDVNQQITFALLLTEPVRDSVYDVMPYDLHFPVCFPAIHAAAAQRAEAFLKALNLWQP